MGPSPPAEELPRDAQFKAACERGDGAAIKTLASQALPDEPEGHDVAPIIETFLDGMHAEPRRRHGRPQPGRRRSRRRRAPALRRD
eukprot:3220399-Prymnesium_polylepis.1